METKRIKVSVWALACLLGLVGLLPTAPARAQTGSRCFTETGFCISGVIRTYWERNGGLEVFGYPIGPQEEGQAEGWTGQMQWFQRDRLEDHGAQGVLAGRLGARSMEIFAVHEAARQTVAEAPQGCAYFVETRHSVCEPFLSYWRSNGGLERFGFPISQPVTEGDTEWRGTVQYFERRRMEHHQENKGTRYEVLLGLLGNDIYKSDHCEHPWFFTPRPKYCASRAAQPLEGAAERFERGVMIWSREPDRFYILADKWYYWILSAPYTARDASPFDETPPPGRYAPVSGFGEIWRDRYVYPPNSGAPQQPMREILGWATEPEHVYQGYEQCFFGGKSYYDQRCYMRGSGDEIVWYGPGGAGHWPEW
jgi:hypothetical protein